MNTGIVEGKTFFKMMHVNPVGGVKKRETDFMRGFELRECGWGLDLVWVTTETNERAKNYNPYIFLNFLTLAY
jgi:hypothetical protein